MSDSKYTIIDTANQSSKGIKLFDNGDGTFSELGLHGVDTSATPKAVNAGVRAFWPTLRNGIPFMIGGHPNTKTKNLQITAADGALTDAVIVSAFEGTAIVVTKLSVNTSKANSAFPLVRIGFGAANVPAADAEQVLFHNGSMQAAISQVEGSGAGIIGIGAAGEDLRVTCGAPTGGDINIIVTYFEVLVGTAGSPSQSPSASISKSASSSASSSVSSSPSPSSSASKSVSSSPSASVSKSISKSPSASTSSSLSKSISKSISKSLSSSISKSPSVSVSSSPSVSQAPTSVSVSASISKSISASISSSASASTG